MPIEDIRIETEEIQLDQFLKWAGVLASGGEVKMLIENRQIKRNGETESARRRKLHAGDIIEIEGLGAWRVVTK
ncbi:MAG: RNA-binding S4 domain-containing protein [Selenomonas sp.]|nr:RNA-binding S4 domain-containing protein [Selenomonadales bacterium]MDD7763743.1 RNA-binding S4 domain-containing protein [Selenomonadales bacterium]MDY5716928.1 RNA-binding S4 domain-containing protein [Selenomonas sp.]